MNKSRIDRATYILPNENTMRATVERPQISAEKKKIMQGNLRQQYRINKKKIQTTSGVTRARDREE